VGLIFYQNNSFQIVWLHQLIKICATDVRYCALYSERNVLEIGLATSNPLT